MHGNWFTGKTSACFLAELQVDAEGQVRVISLADNALLQTCRLADIKVSLRIGNTTRNLHFGGGGKFETQDNTQVDLLLEKYRPSLWQSFIYQLETHIYFVLVNLLLVVGLSWAGMKYAVPAASHVIANQLPQKMLNLTSAETLQLLDKIYLQPTELAENVQARVLQHFAPALKENAHLSIQVIFRGGGDLGANAFALPNGTIIFTDEMVNLAKSDDELIAVLAHEIGHVKYRHGLRSVIQSSSLGFMVSMLMGDMSAASSLLTAVPVILITMSYSRDFERDADQNALEYLDAKNIQRHVFVELMERVTYEARCNFLLQREGYAQNDVNEIHSAAASVAATASAAASVTATASAARSSVAKKSTTGEGQGIKDSAHKSKSKDKVAAEGEDVIPAIITATIEDQLAAKKIQCDKLMATHDVEKETIKDYFSTHPGTDERLQKFK
ncbi:MAG: M48 family metallopeptidase [Pseudomonadota bacterium]